MARGTGYLARLELNALGEYLLMKRMTFFWKLFAVFAI
jgi:hypothetical protein